MEAQTQGGRIPAWVQASLQEETRLGPGLSGPLGRARSRRVCQWEGDTAMRKVAGNLADLGEVWGHCREGGVMAQRWDRLRGRCRRLAPQLRAVRRVGWGLGRMSPSSGPGDCGRRLIR